MGFLHAARKDQPETRLDEMKQAGVTDFGLPELMQGEYLTDAMFDLGPTRAVGMGEGPTDWDIILPYAMANGYDEEDMSILAAMCRGYFEARNAGANLLAISPAEKARAVNDTNG